MHLLHILCCIFWRVFQVYTLRLSHHEYMNLQKRSTMKVFSGSKNQEPVGHAFGRHDYPKNILPNLREKNPQDGRVTIPKKTRNGKVA